jgi:hypothetical protein
MHKVQRMQIEIEVWYGLYPFNFVSFRTVYIYYHILKLNFKGSVS